jgi:hypothetical protein
MAERLCVLESNPRKIDIVGGSGRHSYSPGVTGIVLCRRPRAKRAGPG